MLSMTFTEDSIKKITIDMEDEWQYENDGKEINCMFHGLEDYAERFFDIKEDHPDDYVDCYATIVLDRYGERYVRAIEFQFITRLDIQNRYLTINFNNCEESRMIAAKLYETSHGGLEQMENDLEV